MIYTDNHGKIEVVAKGTKRILSKLNPHLEPLSAARLMVAKGKGYDKLANAMMDEDFAGLKYSENLHLHALWHYVLEITDQLTLTGQADAQIYNNLLDWLRFMSLLQISQMKAEQLNFHAHHYIIRLLSILGFQPELKRCIECAKGLLFPKLTFDFLKGGVICESCAKISLITQYYEISDSVIKILLTAMQENYPTMSNYNFNPADLKDFNNIVHKLALYQLPRELRSMEMLKFLSNRLRQV